MFYWIDLLWTVITAAFRLWRRGRSVGCLATTVVRRLVGPFDIDVNVHFNNALHFRAMGKKKHHFLS